MNKFSLCFSIIILLLSSCETSQRWHPLFNGENLENWDIHLGTPLNGFEELAAKATPEKVFAVIEHDDEKMIHISGEINGSLATRDTFRNYHLQLEYKWGDKVYTSRNSGLLYHSFGEFGQALGTWMVNIECQLMHERLGDTYLMNNTYCESPVVDSEEGFRYEPTGELKKFSIEHNGQLIKKAADYENQPGDWNTIDLYCFGNSSVHVVNGQTTTLNKNTGVIENGNFRQLSSGKIQIQSEGAELFIRTLKIRPIEEIPAKLLN